MKKINRDYFYELLIDKKGKLVIDDIEQAYENILEDMEKQKDRIYDNNAISIIDKCHRLEKLKIKNEKLEKLYEYCIDKDNLNLRNYILGLCDDGKVPNISLIKILEDENGQGSIQDSTIRKVESNISGFENQNQNLAIYEIEKFELVSGIQKTGEYVNKYRIKVYVKKGENPQENDKIEYQFFSEDIDIAKVATDEEYRKNLFRAIEINQMTGNTNYIGYLDIDENGNYMIIQNELINKAVGIYNSIHDISENYEVMNSKNEDKHLQGNGERV